MVDVGNTIAPSSSQLNADDLIGGPVTIKVTKVSANPSSPEQPIRIHFENDNNKPYLPCKSMRRVLVQLWGRDGNKYIGRSMTLCRDPKVQFGGIAVGGVRISHLSDIDGIITLALTTSRSSRKPYSVSPIVTQTTRVIPPVTVSDYANCESLEALEALEVKRQACWASLTKEEKAMLKPAVDAARDKYPPKQSDEVL